MGYDEEMMEMEAEVNDDNDQKTMGFGPSFDEEELTYFFPVSVGDVSISDMQGEDDKSLKKKQKFKLDKFGLICAKKYNEPVMCSLCSSSFDGEVSDNPNLAKYINGDGEFLCYKHLHKIWIEEPARLYNVEKIQYGRVGVCDRKEGDLYVNSKFLNDFDREILQKKGISSLLAKLKGNVGCSECDNDAIYQIVSRKGIKNLCLTHSKKFVHDNWDSIQEIYKLYFKKPDEEEMGGVVEVVNVDMDSMDDEGCVLIPTRDIIRELIRSDHLVISPSYLPSLYRCSDDVAKLMGKGRYKIEDPKTLSEITEKGTSVTERLIVTKAEGSESDDSTHYFNLPKIDLYLSPKKITSKNDLKQIKLSYKSDLINDDAARTVYRRFCMGEVSVHKLDKTTSGWLGDASDENDYFFWENNLQLDEDLQDDLDNHRRRSRISRKIRKKY